MLKIKDLVVSYGGIEAVKSISFDVPDGEIVTLIGANGAGKSTTLRTIAGLVKPKSGSIMFDGEELIGKSTEDIVKRGITLSPEGRHVFPDMTVLENCVVGQRKVLKKNQADSEELAKYYLEKVGMAAYINAKPRQISGGQKQRVAIARALAMEPEVLLFDEPTSALDPQMVGEVLEVMRTLADEGLTMLIVTHEMAFARDVSSRVIFMKDGLVCEEGAPQVIFNNPTKPETREFLSRFMAQ